MASDLRRMVHLLRREPSLLLGKAWERTRRRLAYAIGARKALRGTQSQSDTRHSPLETNLLEVLGRAVPIVVLERQNGLVRCGVLAASVPLVLATVWRAFPEAIMTFDGRLCPADHPKILRASRHVTCIGVTLPGAEDAASIDIDVFVPTDAGSFVNRTGADRVTGVLYGNIFSSTGVIDLPGRMPELVRRVNELPIDIVYTWVDSKDPVWRQAFERAMTEEASQDAVSESRFHSNDELRYSLRSVHLHLPWINRIHIVSNCRAPDWLDTSHPRLSWVPHEAILDAEYLPTFNSHAIETSLHRIPGLAENFLYFNDDFFALAPLSPADFVNDNGTLNAHLEEQAVVNAPPSPSDPDYLNAARNSARLLFEQYGYYPTRLHKHVPYSLSRSLLEEVEGEFEVSFEQTRKARFRALTDINASSFLVHHFGFTKRAVVEATYAAALVKSNDAFCMLALKEIGRGEKRPKVLCINEGGTPAPPRGWRREVSRFMAEQFPLPSPCERQV